jgi:enterobactin synthetase component D
MWSLTSRPNPNVVPPGVVQTTVEFEIGSLGAMTAFAQEHGLTLGPALERAVACRQAEFIAGRYCALAALRRVFPAYVGQLESGEDRCPRWPAEVAGAITHTRTQIRGLASAAVAPRTLFAGLGIDSERLVSHETAAEIGKLVWSMDQGTPDCRTFSVPVACTLQLSAKESVFKCLYPLVRRFFSFEDVDVELGSPGERQFRAVLRRDLAGRFPIGTVVHGRYEIEEDRVHTAAWMPPLA